MYTGSTLSNLCGLVRDEAAPKITIIAQMITPSESAEDKRSAVTSPPILMPGIHVGTGIRGRVKITFPGMGTPMDIPINVRIERIQRATFSVQLKLLPQGASSLSWRTMNATRVIAPSAK
jgi:hypothetical protein